MIGTPSGWREVSVGDICEFKYGKSLAANKRTPGEYAVYGSNGVVGTHSGAITDGPAIIIGRKGSLGEVTYSPTPCWPIDTTYFIDATSTKADLRWLSLRLSALRLTELNRAAAVPGLNREDAYRKRLLLPPLEEQRRIAEVLDRADELRAKRRRALAHLDELTRSIFLGMFPPEMSTTSLGDHLSFVTSGGRGWAQFYAESGKRFIRSLDVRMNEIGSKDAVYVKAPDNTEARRTAVRTGDVLLTITGSRIGRVAVVPSELKGAYISQHVAILRLLPGNIRPDFLSFYLSLKSGGQRQIAKAQYGQTKPGLNFDQIREFLIPLPPLSMQDEFRHRRNEVEKLKAAHTAALAELDALFASLQDRAFKGSL